MTRSDPEVGNLRQMVYWRLLSAASGLSDTGASLESMAAKLASQLGLPSEILNPTIGVDVLLHRYPKLVPHFEAVERCVQASEEEAVPSPLSIDPSSESIEDDDGLRRAFAFSKLLLNVFGPNTNSSSCTAAQYSQWCQDVATFERCMGFEPGSLRSGGGSHPDLAYGGSGVGEERDRAEG